INSFELVAAELAVEKGYDYVVCGHIHQPEKREIAVDNGKVMYLNSGDWVESLTALEYHEQSWSVFKYDHKDFIKDEMDDGILSDAEDLKSKLDINILLQNIKYEIA
ncbi:MAG: UDP-2,3-diacylglucosamine diphosphatase, partial [Sphingobacteriales bacterium]